MLNGILISEQESSEILLNPDRGESFNSYILPYDEEEKGVIFSSKKEEQESSNILLQSAGRDESFISAIFSYGNGILGYLNIFRLMSDERGSIRDIFKLLLILACAGTVLGVLLPKDSDLENNWYPTVSSCIGYYYFVAWSISFYPQILSNYRLKSTKGLSVEFCLLNVFGFACYTAYTCAFFWLSSLKDEYRDKHDGDDNTVASNDVAFAIHALFMTIITLGQIIYYSRTGSNCQYSIKPSKWVLVMCVLFIVVIVIDAMICVKNTEWLQFFYVLSVIKIIITLTKYIPQALLNYRRKSTAGWNIWNIVLDLTGGILSFTQLILDSWNMNDWDGVIGNPAKLGISCISITFDLLFIVQHYYLYPHSPQENITNNHEEIPQDEYFYKYF